MSLMRDLHFPIWLEALHKPGPTTFALLFAIGAFTRAILVTVIPLQALAQFGDAQKVSVFFFGVGTVALAGSMAIPYLVHLLRPRWVFTLGSACLLVSTVLLASGTLTGLITGMALYVFGIACAEVALTLYVMDHVPRREFTRFEPLRMFYMAGAWTLGPWLGVYLQQHVTHWMPYAISFAGAVVMFVYFLFLRLAESPTRARRSARPPNPTRFLPRFFSQPRLALAWILAFGRSGWWLMFFVYAPIYAVNAGFDEIVSGAIVSVGTAAQFLVPAWGWVARRYGVRRLLIGGYTAAGIATIGVSLLAGIPWAAAFILICAAFSASTIDGVGNVPFMRAVRPFERPEMTSVFLTYRDSSRLAPPGVFSLLLKVFELPVVFVVGGVGMLVLAFYSRYIPRRL